MTKKEKKMYEEMYEKLVSKDIENLNLRKRIEKAEEVINYYEKHGGLPYFIDGTQICYSTKKYCNCEFLYQNRDYIKYVTLPKKGTWSYVKWIIGKSTNYFVLRRDWIDETSKQQKTEYVIMDTDNGKIIDNKLIEIFGGEVK